MAIPFAAIAAGMSAAKLISGLFALDDADKLPPELQDAYDLLLDQAQHGLPQDVESRMLSQGTTRINQAAAGQQAAGSMALASRGMGASSAADSLLSQIAQGAMNATGDLVSNVGQLDEQVRQQGVAGLAGISNQIAQYKGAKSAGASELIMGGALGLLEHGGVATGLFGAQKDPLEEFLNSTMGQRFLDLGNFGVPIPSQIDTEATNQYYKFG